MMHQILQLYVTCVASIMANDSTSIEVHRHCAVPDHFQFGFNCLHTTILPGTTCDINYICPENMFSNAVQQTCHHNGTWAGEPLIPICHYRHCPIPEHYGSNCDGTILEGTMCDIFFLCDKEGWFSIKVTLTCQEDSTWDEQLLDPNCYDSLEPTLKPTPAPTAQISTYDDICEQMCPDSPICVLCYSDELAPEFCHSGASTCTVNQGSSTIEFMEESMCASFGMTQERCYKSGGDYIPQQEICVSTNTEQETCVTKGGEQEVALNSITHYRPGQKACRLTHGYMCDQQVGFLASNRVFVVPEHEPCPSTRDWQLSCDFMSSANNVISEETGAATPLTIYIVVLIVIIQILLF